MTSWGNIEICFSSIQVAKLFIGSLIWTLIGACKYVIPETGSGNDCSDFGF